MRLRAVKTPRLEDDSISLEQLLDQNLSELAEGSLVAITSKVVAICEGRQVPIGSVDKIELIKREADYYLPLELSTRRLPFTITKGTLIMVAGIDESNANGQYVLWPKDPQRSANQVRAYLAKRFGLKRVGVLITDSTALPLHYGTHGITVAFSGFVPNHSYIGQPDLFGRPFKVSIANNADALSAAAVLMMGEGTERTPIVVIEDLPSIEFTGRNPSKQMLEGFFLNHMNDDLFAPFLRNAPWLRGHGGKD